MDPATSTALAVAGTALSVMGNRSAARASRLEGQRRQIAANYEAEQMEEQAGQRFAAAQRDAMDERRRADLMASRTLALAGASGGGASDATVVRIMASLKAEGSYRSAVALYRGESEARRLRASAKARRLEGSFAAAAGADAGEAYETRALTSAFSGGADLFGRYGRDGPEMSSGAFGTGPGV